MIPDAVVAAAVLPAFSLAAAHWFPWGALPGRHGRPLPRLVSYTIGTAAIVGWASVLGVRFAATATEALVLLWIVAGSAATATLIAWGVDNWLAAHAKARAGEIIEAAARERD